MSAKIFVVAVPSLSKVNGQMAEFGEEITKEQVHNFEELCKEDFLLSRDGFDKKFNTDQKPKDTTPQAKAAAPQTSGE